MVTDRIGAALFFPFHGHSWDNPWDIRLDTVRSLLEGKEPEPYIIEETIEYLPGGMKIALYHGDEREKLIEKYGAKMRGKTRGALHCVLLRDECEDSMLVHLERAELRCAYFPAVTLEQAQFESHLAKHLESLGALAPNTMIELKHGLRPGRYCLKDLLEKLSEHMTEK